jgi:hypothetical protein
MSIRREKRETPYHVNDRRIAHNRHVGWSGNSAFSVRKILSGRIKFSKCALSLLAANVAFLKHGETRPVSPYSDSGSSRIRFTADLASHSRAFCRSSAALCRVSPSATQSLNPTTTTCDLWRRNNSRAKSAVVRPPN